MNWFERYAFPGINFNSYIFCIILFFFPDLFPSDANSIRNLVSLLAATSLPIGYLISIFSLWLYYILRCCHLHEIAAPPALRARFTEEHLIEAESAVLLRIHHPVETIDTGRWAQEWVTKRVDVIAISYSFITATAHVLDSRFLTT